ncbi:MAG TPA: DUF134 domain-containing protein [Methanosarcinaceae archaeon]|nr:DUF134 domain-containing protein [Methanosarcinaceae archaeon]
MVRPRKRRMVDFEHNTRHYSPSGVLTNIPEKVNITIDELEALRLCYLEKLNQSNAALRMHIHQSTLQRTLRRALGNITDALVNGKAINIQGGNYTMPGRNGTGPSGQGSGNIQGRGRGQRGGGGGGRGGGFGGPDGKCKCPNCNYEQTHQPGTPCAQAKCPECGTMMIRM